MTTNVIEQAKDVAREKLSQVVADFKALYDMGAIQKQSEATARSWVEKLLEAFGWDAKNPHQVIQEYHIRGREARRLAREDISHRRPDYTLLINRARTLYIDVKRVDVNILTDESAAFQVRSYGWSAGFTLSYLCDFEELSVYDCRYMPQGDDKADVGRVRHLFFYDYLTNFDFLWDYLGRENIESGSLLRRHPETERPKGAKKLDEAFEEQLSRWRLDIGKSIVRYGQTREARIISGAAQRILDRIIFLRFCEDIGLEELGTLKCFADDTDGRDFWECFAHEHENRYRVVYDGVMFPMRAEDDPTGVEKYLREWWLKGRVWKSIIDHLYYPYPYKFTVIPVELLGGIFEKYLGKRIHLVGAQVKDEYKPEHQRTKGAIYTPSWVVKRVTERTLEPLVRSKDPAEILALKILDPACGSAGFLLGVFDFLEMTILDWCRKSENKSSAHEYAVFDETEIRLNAKTVRSIICGCLYGVDIEAEAVEVARMSLALRLLERTGRDEANEPKDLLKHIGINIKHGNSLVGPDFSGLGLDANLDAKVMVFDWYHLDRGFGTILNGGGFDAVVGNPPYIEVKHYKEWLPEMYTYLTEAASPYVTTRQGKTDIAMPFIEKSVSLLNAKGRLGFIIQNRFFKTDYGEHTRKFLIDNKLIESIEDFRDLQIFPGRVTYTAILNLQKDSKEFEYKTYADEPAAALGIASDISRIKINQLSYEAWSFDNTELGNLHRTLTQRHGNLDSIPQIEITVGLQTLYGKYYQFQPIKVTTQTIIGTNGIGEKVQLERKALRPLCRNRNFYPFRAENADAWVIFPYEIARGIAREILWPEFENLYPKTAQYLRDAKRKIQEAVETEKGNRWHLYLYPKNLVSQAQPKILFPATVEDTWAAVDLAGDIYQDNVRIQALTASIPINYLAITAIFNSSIFNALAKLRAGLSEGGWRQLNRQFINLVPFPKAALATNTPLIHKLADLAEKISGRQTALIETEGEATRGALIATLSHLWNALDAAVEDLYELTAEERKIIASHPRKVDRVDLLLRQSTGRKA